MSPAGSNSSDPATNLAPDASGVTPQATPAEEHYAVAAIQAAVPGAVEAVKFSLGETTITVQRESIVSCGEAVKAAGYVFLEDVTATDWYPGEPRFHIVYHILSLKRKERIRLKLMVDSGDTVVNSITPVWPSANFYEREVFDLFGIRFGAHPNMRRILMPDDWEGHPLRKDYPVEGYR